VLADEWLAAAAKEAAQNERDDDDVVELAGDRDEVGYEVKWKREVSRECEQERLLPPRDAGVAEQAAAEDDAVGNEPGERPGALAPAGDHESDDEQRIEEKGGASCDKKPVPQAHASRVIRPSTPLRDESAGSAAVAASLRAGGV
jgi:hypothetical protein